jgi:RecB family exonuclease
LRSLKIKKYESLDELEKLSLVDFSYSRIDTYTQCPSKYFYSYIQKEPRLFNPPAVLGNIVHNVLEDLLDNNKELDLDELQSEYEKNIPKWDPDNLIPTELINVGKNILDEFYDRHSDEKFNIYDKELNFDMILGSYRIRGFIDRVDVIGNKVIITDYKTGKWEVTQKDIANNLQLGIYALAASEIFPGKQIYAELYYLRSGKRKGHLFSFEELYDIKNRLVDLMSKIVEDRNFTATSNPRLCSYCDHAKSGACGVGVYRNSKR